MALFLRLRAKPSYLLVSFVFLMLYFRNNYAVPSAFLMLYFFEAETKTEPLCKLTHDLFSILQSLCLETEVPKAAAEYCSVLS